MTNPDAASTVARALEEAKAAGLDRLDAQLLLGRQLNRSRAWLIAHDDSVLTSSQHAEFRATALRRAGGEPLAYIVGEKEFHGLSLQVNPGVLVPRPDTETLVDWAIDLLRSMLAETPSPRVVDLGTGSGAIALAMKHSVRDADVTATDASEQALAVARANGLRLGLAVSWRSGHWWRAVTGDRFHLAVSNPPYVAQEDPHLAALMHEPAMALASGIDGLDAIREIVAGAHAHLHPGGWLLMEHGHDQARAVAALLDAAGFVAVRSRADLAGISRCTAGQVAPRPQS